MRVPLLMVLLGLAGCDLVRIGDYGDYGEFEATVEGALDLQIHGTAISQLRTDVEPSEFTLGLHRLGVNYGGFITFRAEGEDRRTGTYPIGPGQMEGVYDVDTRTDQEFVAVSGELVVREIQEEDLLGAFDFTAVDAAGDTIRVRGDYRARKRTTPWPE